MTTSTRKVGRPHDPELGERRREKILAAAGPLFAEKGYSATDVDAVAKQTAVAKGTIYRYFHGKDRLFFATVDRGMRLLRDQVERGSSGVDDPLDRINLAIRSYLSYFDANPWLVELVIQERACFKNRKKPTYFEHRDTSVGPWRKLFRALIREGRIRDIPVNRITDAISDLLYGTIFTNHFSGRRKSFNAQARDVLDVLFHGILPEKERPIRFEPGRKVKGRTS
ncbi:MAG: TetR/AcrR family transcriptional regulator [Planctomycetota bacterium]